MKERRKLVLRILMSKIMQIDKSKKFTQFFEEQKLLRKIDFLVLHHVEADSAEHAIEQFEQHQVSAHFLIDEQGKIFELVAENNIAYHAGVSFWAGIEGLNKNSIGIEFINAKAFEKKFEKAQMAAGVELCLYLIKKYFIRPRNIVGHSDIAYDRHSGLLDRKQDPSHFFNWKFLSENGVGIFPQLALFNQEEKKLFELGNKDVQITKIKQDLQKFGYRVTKFNDEFDDEMQALTLVFNRHFLGRDSEIWFATSQAVLDELVKTACKIL